MSSEPWQRLHPDYYGPFPRVCFALVVVGALAKLPEFAITTHVTADFILKAPRTAFNKECVPVADVTDTGSYFLGKTICQSIYVYNTTPSRVEWTKPFKSASHATNPTTLEVLEQKVDNYLLHYRNAVHCSTREAFPVLLKSQHLKSNVMELPAAKVMFPKRNAFRMAYIGTMC